MSCLKHKWKRFEFFLNSDPFTQSVQLFYLQMSYYIQTIFKIGNFSPRHILIPAFLETVAHESESYNIVQSSIFVCNECYKV